MTRIESFQPRRDPAFLDSPAFETCLEIRRQVFVVGQGVPEELEWDGLDEEAEHFLATETETSTTSDPARAIPLGTARMRSVNGFVKAERVAVLETARERGTGRALMRAIERRARTLGLRVIRLNAQVPVIAFYEKLGYRAHGEVFEEAGIAHRAMQKDLAADESADQTVSSA